MKKQNYLKSMLCLLLGLVCNAAWAQVATIQGSNSVENPEYMYELRSANNYWMTSYTSPTSTASGTGKFAFFAVDGQDGAFKIYSVDRQKWVSYTKADSYSAGANKATLVDTQEAANAWKASIANNYWSFAPYKNDATVASIYWNWHGGVSSNPLDNTNKTIGFYGTIGDGGCKWILYAYEGEATEEEFSAAKSIIKVAPGYPKTTTSAYSALNNLVLPSSKAFLNVIVSAYQTSSDILLPEDGKAYTFTSVMGEVADATKYYMKYINGQKVSVSKTESDASVFVCKELRTGVYAFITSDGHILTWVGNDEGGAYAENGHIYGYSSNYATEFNGKNDWNEITVKKNGTAAKDLGYLRLVGRRKSDAVSSFIANANNRFDQASDGYWFNSTNSSAWILTEVTHTNTDAQTLALAKIDAKVAVANNAAKLGEGIGCAYYIVNGEKVYDAATINTAIDAASTADEVNAIKNSYAVTFPEFGKAYTMTLVANDANKTQYKMIANEATLTASTEGESSVFYCLQSESNDYPYIFVSEDGYVLAYNTLTETYTVGLNGFKVEEMVEKSSGYITSAVADRLGTVCITTNKRSANNNDDGCLIFKYTANAWDNSSAPYHNGTYTSAIVMTEVKNYEMPEAQQTKVENLLGKNVALEQVEAIRNHLKNQIGYYYCTINGEKVYDADAIIALIEASYSPTVIAEITTAVSGKTLILPEVGKYYRIKSNASGNYLDAVNRYSGDQMGLKSEAEYSPTGTIFYLDSENRLRNFATETYIYGTRHIGTANTSEKNAWTFAASARTVGCLTLTSNSSSSRQLHDSDGNRADRCGNICGARHDFIIEEVTELPRHGETYYIYSDTYQNGTFVNRYFYVNGSNALAMNAALATEAAYKWTCTVTDDGYIQFQNGNGKYLSHRGVSDTPYNFTLKKGNTHHGVVASLYSVAADRYFVVKNDGSSFNQSTGIYNQTSGEWCTDFVFLPVDDVKILTIDGSSKVGATVTWNGETKSLPTTWVVTPQTEITVPTLSVTYPAAYAFGGLYENEASVGETIEIESLSADRTITAQFTPAFFSESYGDKWVRLSNCSNTNYWATVENATANGNGKTAILDYADDKQLWCLVGNASSFVLYNKAAGKELALKVTAATYGNGSQATLENDTQANWKLIEQDFGYALVPTHNTNDSNWGINMYGGAGGNLKLYGTAAGNKGSYWMVELVDTDSPLTLNVEVDQVWESSPRVAELTLSINGANSQTRILGSVEGKKMYLPTGSTFTLSSMTYRGYTFNGFGGEYIDATIPEGGLEITASYTANEERTLFYSPSKTGKPYRIPAIATAPNGDIFAICDHRPCGGDIGNGDVDIVCRISSDNGATWGDEIVLADGDGGSTNRMETGYGDPAIVVDRESNKILVMMVAGRTVCGNSRWDASKIGDKEASLVNRAARIYGTYNETKNEWEWTQPVEVTDDIYKLFLDENNNATVTSYFIGSGKICQSRVVKKGEYYRLYCALWTRDEGNRVLYSDDFGGTWNVLGTIADRPATGGNEPKCEELPDGTVLLSSRVPGGRYFNFFTFDNEGKSEEEMYTTGSWGTVAKSTETYDGSSQGTNGEIYKVKAIRKSDGQICDVMLQSVPAGPGGRYNVTVYYKEMDYTVDYSEANAPATFATGWAVGKQVSEKYSAYSTMILQADGRIGFLFEEAPNECIIYIPYTLDELTDNKYSLYTVTSTITDVKVGTFYASEAVQIPEGVKAYVADENNLADGVITMTQLEDIIPAHTGAVLRGEADSYEFIPSISYGTPIEDNMLVGYEAANSKEENRLSVEVDNTASIYVLANDDSEGAKFYKKSTNFTVKNNKAYLRIPNATLAQGLRIRFGNEENGEGGTTSIDEGQLTIDNGQLTIYDLQGRRVLNPTKGMYIVNGKKIVIK